MTAWRSTATRWTISAYEVLTGQADAAAQKQQEDRLAQKAGCGAGKQRARRPPAPPEVKRTERRRAEVKRMRSAAAFTKAGGRRRAGGRRAAEAEQKKLERQRDVRPPRQRKRPSGSSPRSDTCRLRGRADPQARASGHFETVNRERRAGRRLSFNAGLRNLPCEQTARMPS